MGKCATRTKKIVKLIAAELSPIGVQLIATIVTELDPLKLDNATKRAAAIAAVKAAFQAAKIQAGENAIRAGIEATVAGLKRGQEWVADLGTADATPDELAPES